MASGISIGVGADTRDFAKGVQSGIVKPLEDAQHTFGDVAKAGDQATDKLEAGFQQQQRATQDFAADYKRMSADVQAASQRTSRSISSDADDFSHRTREGFDEIKESARSNAIEVGASFTGGFDQAAGGLQGFLAEFLAGFGPAGIVAGIAAATGLGLITQQVDQGTQAAETQKQAVADLAQEYIDAGKAGRRSFENVRSSIEAMATSTDPNAVVISLQSAWDKAKLAGADYQDIVEAIASGSPTEIQRAIDAVERLRQKHDEAASAATNDGTATYSSAIRGAKAANELTDALDKAKATADKAGQAQKLAADAGVSALQLQQDALQQVEKAYDDAAGSAGDFVNKQGEFDAAGFIKKMKNVRHELEEYKDDLAKTDLSGEAKKFLESQGAETAAAMLRGYQKATPTQKAQLAEIWSTAGDDNATTYGAALGKNLAKIKPKVNIPAPIVPAPDDRALRAYLSQPKYLRVVVDAYTRTGQRIG